MSVFGFNGLFLLWKRSMQIEKDFWITMRTFHIYLKVLQRIIIQ